jgi:hypothetical protein
MTECAYGYGMPSKESKRMDWTLVAILVAAVLGHLIAAGLGA